MSGTLDVGVGAMAAGTEALRVQSAATSSRKAARHASWPAKGPVLTLVRKVEANRTRDELLTDFGKTTLQDRYLLPGESYQDMFARVATAYADDADHAQRIYDYISRQIGRAHV